MKNLLLLLGLLVSMMVSAQSGKGYPQNIDAKTIVDAETIYFETSDLYKSGTLSISALCEQTGDSVGGTMTIQGSTDGVNFFGLTDVSGLVNGIPNDTFTVTDDGVGAWVIYDNPFAKVRIKVVGVDSASYLITPSYINKN